MFVFCILQGKRMKMAVITRVAKAENLFLFGLYWGGGGKGLGLLRSCVSCKERYCNQSQRAFGTFANPNPHADASACKRAKLLPTHLRKRKY